MGRNSVEATKASRIWAVRARRAALLVRLAGLRVCALPWALFFVDFALEELEDCAVAWGLALVVDWPAIGVAASSAESAPASQRAGHGTGFGEVTTLMSPLYAEFTSVGQRRTSRVTGTGADDAGRGRIGATGALAGLVPRAVVRYTQGLRTGTV